MAGAPTGAPVKWPPGSGRDRGLTATVPEGGVGRAAGSRCSTSLSVAGDGLRPRVMKPAEGLPGVPQAALLGGSAEGRAPQPRTAHATASIRYPKYGADRRRPACRLPSIRDGRLLKDITQSRLREGRTLSSPGAHPHPPGSSVVRLTCISPYGGVFAERRVLQMLGRPGELAQDTPLMDPFVRAIDLMPSEAIVQVE